MINEMGEINNRKLIIRLLNRKIKLLCFLKVDCYYLNNLKKNPFRVKGNYFIKTG